MSLEALFSDVAEHNRIFRLCDIIRETSFKIHKFHRYGHLEKVYENALGHRLRKVGIEVMQQLPLPVFMRMEPNWETFTQTCLLKTA